jgi:biotin carboxyl carrier protein
VKDVYRRRGGAAHEVVVEATGPLAARVRTGTLDAELAATPLGPGRFRLRRGAESWLVCVDREGAARHVTVVGVGEARFEREAKGRRRRERPAGSLASPMPGTVVKVLVKAGDRVAKGAELLLVEAMKMEIKIEAPIAGTVREVRKGEGEPCDAGETLVEIAPEGAAA